MSDRKKRRKLTPDLLLHAYAAGVFPMADNADVEEVFWVDPKFRGIFPLDEFTVPRSLRKRLRRGGHVVTTDRDFRGVIKGCATRESTWINSTIADLYIRLHCMGFAHSVEVYMDGELAGGLYGVKLGGAFFGESMFSLHPDASKIALVHLVARLNAGGFTLLDTQFVTDHLARFGAVEIERKEYLAMLEKALSVEAEFDTLSRAPNYEELLQFSTQTSKRG